jgi:hypothetical protein
MNLQQRIDGFAQLGDYLNSLPIDSFTDLSDSARQENPWFTPDNVQRAISGIGFMLNRERLTAWVSRYTLRNTNPKTVGLVMAGNIPLVGFHDFLCVLLAGHNAQVKLSSKDSVLMRHVADRLISIAPDFRSRIELHTGQLHNVHAVIATGSDNSARYFTYYFGKYPHIIRKNRTSVAILRGSESEVDLRALGKDVFAYFGLGCRNVSKIFVPTGFEMKKLAEAWNNYAPIIHHHKYANNYDYQKSILLVNRLPFLDTGYLLLLESEKLVSPISMIYYQHYPDEITLQQWLKEAEPKLQCIVGRDNPSYIPFGMTQQPSPDMYADNADTLAFLQQLA